MGIIIFGQRDRIFKKLRKKIQKVKRPLRAVSQAYELKGNYFYRRKSLDLLTSLLHSSNHNVTRLGNQGVKPGHLYGFSNVTDFLDGELVSPQQDADYITKMPLISALNVFPNHLSAFTQNSAEQN